MRFQKYSRDISQHKLVLLRAHLNDNDVPKNRNVFFCYASRGQHLQNNKKCFVTVKKQFFTN